MYAVGVTCQLSNRREWCGQLRKHTGRWLAAAAGVSGAHASLAVPGPMCIPRAVDFWGWLMCLFPAVAVSLLQVGIIGPDKKFKILTSAEVQDYLQEVE